MKKKSERERVSFPIPGFVHALNSTAERSGFKTSIGLEKLWDNSEHPEIVSTWTGPREAWMALDFLPEALRIRAHLSVGSITTINWPGRCWPYSLLLGHLSITDGGVVVKVSGGALPIDIERRGDLEVIGHDEWVVYYGGREALLASGLCEEKQFPKRKRWQNSKTDCEQRYWLLQSFPGTDSFAYWEEREEVARPRIHKWQQWHLNGMRGSPSDYEIEAEALPFPSAAARAAQYDGAFRSFMSRLLPNAGGASHA